MWRSLKTIMTYNGLVIEDLLEIRHSVCVNDGNKTRVDIRSGKESALDLTLVSNNLTIDGIGESRLGKVSKRK